VLVGEVNYINYETEAFAVTDGFNFIMHKRISFAYERELRTIFWEMDGTPDAQSYKTQSEPGGLAIAVDLPALIERVYVSPTAAPWFSNLVEAMTAKCGFAFPVSQSVVPCGGTLILTSTGHMAASAPLSTVSNALTRA
jgi:hypothetical protein